MDYLNAPIEFETKAFGDAGTFEGYAAIFGNADDSGDVIQPGAFKEFVRNSDGKTVILNMHNQRDPIGVADVVQDSKGLAFKGQLVLDAYSARGAYALMKAKALTGMSMGYRILAGGSENLRSGGRSLKSLRLFEISPVTFGMNDQAGIFSVKACDQVKTIREFEDFLRDVGGFSWQQAKQLASAGWAGGQKARDEPNDQAGESLQLLKGFAL